MLKGRSEVDLLVFFNNLTCFDDQFKLQKEVIEEIQKHLCQFQQEKRLREKFKVQSSDQPNFRSVSFKLSYPKFQQEVEFHMQTAYDALCKSASSKASPCPSLCLSPLFYSLCLSVCLSVYVGALYTCVQTCVLMFACVGNGQAPALEVGYLRAYFG